MDNLGEILIHTTILKISTMVLNLNLILIVGILSSVMNLFMTDVDNLGRMATLLRLRA